MDKEEELKAWVQTWQQAGKALKEIKWRELRHYDYEKHLSLVDSMLQWAYEHREERLTSGLVEQQRWFMKLREESEEEKPPEHVEA
jgi:hypothetical protein